MLQIAKRSRLFAGSESGLTLLETIAALAILGTVAVGFLSGLATTSKAVIISQERVTAEGLAKSQLESIKTQVYIPTAEYNPADPAKCYALIDISDELIGKGYSIDINPPTTIISPDVGESFELQSITVVIRRNGEELLTVSDYKVGGVTG